MLTVQELFARLSFGALSNLAISGEGDGTIIEAKQPSIIEFANEGLLRLHTQFVLIEKEVILEQQEDVTKYKIHSDNGVANGGLYQYVQDTEEEPFLNDLLRIEAVYNQEGCAYPLNDPNNDDSLYTPQIDVLQVPTPIEGVPLYITYQAKHIPLTLDPVDTAEEIHIPSVLEEALLAFISHKVFSSMNGQEHKMKADEHWANYKSICLEVIDRDIVSSSSRVTNTKLDDRGFV
jgi:hypothetical protein